MEVEEAVADDGVGDCEPASGHADEPADTPAGGPADASADEPADPGADEPAGEPAQHGIIGAFVRFVVFGGGVSVLSSGVLLLTAGWAPFALANAVVTVASTLLATELHHRFTFGAAGKGAWRRAGLAGWRIHAKSALTLAVAYLMTTAAVLILDAADPHTGPLLTQAVYLGASGLAGTGRFLVLRLVVFARRPARRAGSRLDRGSIAVAA